MRILLISGDHRRHLHLVRAIHARFGLSGAIYETREAMTPAPPADASQHDRANWVRHFAGRDAAERRYFPDAGRPECPAMQVAPAALNSASTAAFARDARADVALVFGTGLIRPPLLDALPAQTLNMHGGLSPRYRGTATLFWPFYFLEPTHAGMTFHYLVGSPDAGDVVHQTTPALDAGDGIHDVGCKAVIAGANDAIHLLDRLSRGGAWLRHRQKSAGRLFLSSDFRPEHLRVNYDLFDDRMCAHALDGRLKCAAPHLVRAF